MDASTYRTHVEFKDITKDHGIEPADTGIRVFGGANCASLQLRTGASPLITSMGKTGGKRRRMIATANYLTQDEIKAVIAQLQSLLRDEDE